MPAHRVPPAALSTDALSIDAAPAARGRRPADGRRLADGQRRARRAVPSHIALAPALTLAAVAPATPYAVTPARALGANTPSTSNSPNSPNSPSSPSSPNTPSSPATTRPTITVTPKTMPALSTVIPLPPTVADQEGSDDDTFTIPLATGVDYAVDGVPVDPTTYGTPQPVGRRFTFTVTATPQAGYTFPDGATTTWTWITEQPAPEIGPVTVESAILDATPPTARVTWSAANAVSYDVTYHRILEDGRPGPELRWFTGTALTSANFVVDPDGGHYVVTVVATDSAGNRSDPASTTIIVNIERGFTDVAPGQGTFRGPWLHLSDLLRTQNLPYYNDTAALGYPGAVFTTTLPEGTRAVDLYATVHPYGARGKILIDGRNWADFETNARYWGAVTDPYMYPVRTVSGWEPDPARPTVLTVVVTDTRSTYLALDAYGLRS